MQFISHQQNAGQNYNIKDSQQILSQYDKLYVIESDTNKSKLHACKYKADGKNMAESCLRAEAEEAIWVQDEATGRWRNWHNDELHNL